MQFATALERGSAEEAARLHGELQADLYAIQAHMAKLEQAGREQAWRKVSWEELEVEQRAPLVWGMPRA